MTEPLKPCPNPWCRSHKAKDCEIRAAQAPIVMPSKSSLERAVACPVCPIQTPWFETEAEAITAWSTRPPASDSTGAGDALLIKMKARIEAWDDEEPRDDWWAYQREYADAYRALSQPSPDAEEDNRSWLGKSIDRIDAMEEAAAYEQKHRRNLMDPQRMLWRDDVEGICRSPDMCFEYGDHARCGPCAIDQSKTCGVTPDLSVPNLPEVYRLRRELAALRDAMRDLYRGYVRLLASGRDRILFLGGECDPVDRMEEGDPVLIAAREALSTSQAGEAQK